MNNWVVLNTFIQLPTCSIKYLQVLINVRLYLHYIWHWRKSFKCFIPIIFEIFMRKTKKVAVNSSAQLLKY